MRVGKGILWLVKSGERILGPFPQTAVNDKLRSREFVALDEIARANGRWTFIRDEPSFAKIVEEIRVRNMRALQDENTRSLTDPDNLTATQTATPLISDELTAEITQIPAEVVQDVVFQSIDDSQGAKRSASPNAYVFEGDSQVLKSAEKATRWVWVATIILVVSAISFVMFRQFVAKPIQQKAVAEESLTKAMEALELGDYDLALKEYDRAYTLDPDDEDIYLQLGILKIQIEDQAFSGRRLLEKILKKSDRDAKKVLTGIGLSYLAESNSSQAESFFNKALSVDPLFTPAVVNLGAAAIYQEDYHKASNHLQLAIKDGSRDGIEYLMLTEALLKIFQREKDSRYLQEGIRYLDIFLETARDYQLEANLAQLYLDQLSTKKFSLYDKIDELLDMDLRATEDHRHNLFFHRSLGSWKRIAQWCLKMTQDLEPNSHVTALEATCLMKAGDLAEASRKIDDSISQTPRDPLVQAVFAHLMLEIGSVDRALVASEKAVEFDTDKRWRQALRVRARACEASGNLTCADKAWQDLLEKEPDSLAALVSVADANVRKKQFEEAKRFVSKGLRLSSQYRPLIDLGKEVGRLDGRARNREGF